MQRSSLSRSFLSSSRVGGDLDTSIVLNDSLSIDSKQTKLEEKVASFLASGAIEVSFSDTHLQDAGCVIVCAALKEKDAAHVVSLNLRGNAIALSGTLALCELLRAHAGLRSLCLEWNDLGKENSMDKLADALCLNRTLAYVCNSYINLSLSCFCKCIGVLLLLDLLFYLATVYLHESPQLDLRNNKLGPENAPALSRIFSQNQSITHVGMYFIRISLIWLVVFIYPTLP